VHRRPARRVHRRRTVLDDRARFRKDPHPREIVRSDRAALPDDRLVVDRFTHAIAEATVYANAHEAEMIPLLAPFLKVDPQLVARTMKGSEGIYLDPASIQPMIDVTAKYGIIDHAFTAADIISPAALKRPAHA
jgi:hypothetical protein